MIKKQYGKVDLKIYDSRAEMGRAAAEEAAPCMRKKSRKSTAFLQQHPLRQNFCRNCANSLASIGVV